MATKKKKLTRGQINKANYIKDYTEKTYRLFTVKIRKDKEDVINKLDSVPSKAEYITRLVEEDIKKEG